MLFPGAIVGMNPKRLMILAPLDYFGVFNAFLTECRHSINDLIANQSQGFCYDWR